MFDFRVIFILHALFFLTKTQHDPLKLNLLRDGTSVYCVISEEKESTAVGLFNNNKPVQSFKHQIDLIKLTNTNFFCDISTNEACKDVLDNKSAWKYDKSDNYNLPVITDRRWEDFNIIESGRINFVNVYNVTEVNQPLQLKLELKIEKDAHIYLCDGMDPLNSNCYWFVIGGWVTKSKNESKSIARICKKKELEKSYVEGVFGNRNESCSKHPEMEKEPHTKKHTIFLSTSKWTLLLLEELKNDYVIKYNTNNTVLIQTKMIDNYKISVKHIFVASPSNAPGKWRVRNEDFNSGGFKKIHDKLNSSFHFSIVHPTNPNDDGNNYNTFVRLCKQDYEKGIEISIRNGPISHWKHFNFQSNTSHFVLFDTESSSTVKTGTITDNSVLYIAVQSRHIAYWKKHVYGVFVAQKSNVSSIPFAKGIKGQRICVGIFVYCTKCALSFEIIDSNKNVLITTTYSKQKSWEQIKLETILKKDVQMDLKIILDKVDSNNPAFIGDITDCTRNVRIIKTISDKSDQISCKSIKHPSISPVNATIVFISSFENTSDALWLPKNNSCKKIVSKQELEKALKCSIITLNYEEFIEGEEICFLSDIRKNTSASNPICEILGLNKINYDKIRRSYLFLWLVGPVTILLIFLVAVIYFKIKKNSTSSRSSWMYFSRAYTLLGGIMGSNRSENTALEMSEDNNSEFSCLIDVKDFGSYVKDGSENILIQFLTIDNLKPLEHTIGCMKEHIHKNRYKNIIAYDSTRVVLDSTYQNVHDSYINANYITGYRGKPLYIATQGPMATTVHDFWRMIWQENVSCVVMLTKVLEDDKIKCHKYWPDDDKTFDCCAFKITCTNSNLIQEDLTIRHLKVTFSNEERILTQIHYEGWLDYKTAESLEGVKKVLNLMNDFEENGGRIVVHCSAGVGRTGSLILCDIAIKMAEDSSKLDLYSILYNLRQERMNMVQNIAQYQFSHKVVAYILENTYINV
nr:uncharacterized protein LOC111413081 [Onthophagus taurus]